MTYQHQRRNGGNGIGSVAAKLAAIRNAAIWISPWQRMAMKSIISGVAAINKIAAKSEGARRSYKLSVEKWQIIIGMAARISEK